MNIVAFTGVLTRDAEVVDIPGSGDACRFHVAVSDGEGRQTIWISVTILGKLAAAVLDDLWAGQIVTVHGSLDYRAPDAGGPTLVRAKNVIPHLVGEPQ